MSESSERSDSVFTDNADHFLNNDDLNETLRAQKDQQYHCLHKLDQQFNASNIAQINLHQDTEFNEVMTSVEIILNTCMLNIHKNDGLITLANPSLFNNSRLLNNSGKGRKMTTKDPASIDSNTLENIINSNSCEKSIIIDSLVPLDFIRNGLKSGPLQIQQGPQLFHEQTNLTMNSEQKSTGIQSAVQSAAALPGLSRSNTQANISLASQLNYKVLIGSKNLVIFKYLIAVDLNSDYFDCRIINDKESIYSIRSLKRPANWSKFDYDQFTIDIQSTAKEPLNRIFENIISLSANSAKSAYKTKPIRFLNSKALFDRLYKHFYKTIIKDWSNFESQNLKFNSEYKSCEIKDNQLKIVLKFKGIKQKDLDVIIYLNVGIKYTDEIIENKTIDSMILLSNNFFQNGGFFIKVITFYLKTNLKVSGTVGQGCYAVIKRTVKPPVISRASMVTIINFLYRNFKINLSSIYLLPNCIHHWTLYLLPLKFNFLTWLIWLNSFHPRTVGTDIIINLFNGEDKATNAQLKLLVANHLTNKGSVMKQNYCLSLLLTNNINSNLFLLVRMIQLFNHLSLNKSEIAIKMENYNSSEEELIADLIFLEINYNSCFNSRGHKIRQANNVGDIWCNENIFDRLWSILFKLRSAMIVEHILPDPFKIFRNALPCLFIKHITLQFYSKISFQNSVLDSNSNLDANEVRACIETAMKLIFINVVNDDTREIRNFSQNKSQSVILSDIVVKRQNTMNLPVVPNISTANTVGSNIDLNDV